MGLGRYVVDAVVLEGRRPTDVARDHNISRTWIYELLARYRAGGYVALQPRSRRPRSCAHQTAPKVKRAILRLRRELLAAGHDAGPATIAHHLARRVAQVPSVATIWRILRRHGLVTPQPQKRPRSSLIRFEAALQELGRGEAANGEKTPIVVALEGWQSGRMRRSYRSPRLSRMAADLTSVNAQ